MSGVPTWDQYMAPALQVLLDGEVHRARDICASAADLLGVSAEERLETIPSGQQRYRNRANWALSYLYRAGAAERPVRGHYRITDAGRKLCTDHPHGIKEKDLPSIDGAVPPSTVVDPPDDLTELDPVEQVSLGVERLHSAVATDLLNRLHANEPAFFEQAVLGLSRIYVQAKRYALDSTIDRPTIQAFVGALHGNQANQGVFITTARFSSGARAYADSVPTRVVLIDGKRMASLMIRYGVGVQVNQTVHIVEVDEDFFE